MPSRLSIEDLQLSGKKALIRVDFNVPFDKNANITDDTRIRASLPTIQYVLDHGGSVVLMSHLGRPKGKPNPELSLSPCAKRLGELLGREVIMAPDCIGDEVEQIAKTIVPGMVLLLENLRFHRTEEHPEEDPSFAKKLAHLGDCYINDAFGTAHRVHASTVAVAHHFPGQAAVGFLMNKEIQFLGETLLDPKRPFYAILGGDKVSSKLGVIKALLKKVDALLVGGGMTYTFLKAQGIDIGNSLCEDALLAEANEILSIDSKLQLPLDHVVADQFNNEAHTKIVKIIPSGFQGMDIGPETIYHYNSLLQKAATVFWNGPLGVFEFPNYAKGTQAIAKTLAQLKVTTIVGGGDSVVAIKKAGLTDQFTHLSTGGGASLEYIEHGKLPGIEALTEKMTTKK